MPAWRWRAAPRRTSVTDFIEVTPPSWRTSRPTNGTFDVTGHPAGPVRIGPLAIPYHATRAFAVSLEHGRAIPPAPASPVALGHIRS